jgi:hypothetical protein
MGSGFHVLGTHDRASARKRSNMANAHIGSSIDDFLEEECVRDAFQARAVKEAIAWQLAALMKTSRTQIDRVLDPENGFDFGEDDDEN